MMAVVAGQTGEGGHVHVHVTLARRAGKGHVVRCPAPHPKLPGKCDRVIAQVVTPGDLTVLCPRCGMFVRIFAAL